MPTGIRTVTGKTSRLTDWSIAEILTSQERERVIRTQRKFLLPNYTQMEMRILAEFQKQLRPFARLRKHLAQVLLK